MFSPGIIITSVLVLTLLLAMVLYNKLVKAKNQLQNAISSLDALFIKRSELITNLVGVVKEYMQYETQTLEKITAMRQPQATDRSSDHEGIEAFKGLLIQAENYPELKANTQFTNLQFSWNEAEEQIAAGRRYISSSVTYYNDAISTFPALLIAKMFGFEPYAWQYATKAQQTSIDAKNLFQK